MKNISAKMNCGNKEFIDSLNRNGIPYHNGIVYGDILNELEEFAQSNRYHLVILGSPQISIIFALLVN